MGPVALRWLGWAVKALVFLALLAFAVKNADPIKLRYLLGQEWEAPLAFVLLLFFAAGAVLGVLASLAYLVRQRRELLALRRERRGRAEEPAARR